MELLLIVCCIAIACLCLLAVFPVSDVPRSHTRRARSQRYQQEYPEDYDDDIN